MVGFSAQLLEPVSPTGTPKGFVGTSLILLQPFGASAPAPFTPCIEHQPSAAPCCGFFQLLFLQSSPLPRFSKEKGRDFHLWIQPGINLNPGFPAEHHHTSVAQSRQIYLYPFNSFPSIPTSVKQSCNFLR